MNIKSCVVFLLLTMFLVPVFHGPVLADGMGSIGEISEASGEIFLLTDEIWIKIDVVPVTIGDGDKIMTHNGRATLVLEGGVDVKVNRFSFVDTAIDASNAEIENLDDVPAANSLKNSDRILSLVLGELSIESTSLNLTPPRFIVKSPTATAMMTGPLLEVSVGIDGETAVYAPEGVKLSGRYKSHGTGIYTDGTPGNILAHKTVLDALGVLVKTASLDRLQLRDLPVIAKEVLRSAWPDMSGRLLEEELVEKQLAESKRDSDEAVAYLQGWIDGAGLDVALRDGSTLQSWPESIAEHRGTGRHFGMPGFMSLPEGQGGRMDIRFHAALATGGVAHSNVFSNVPGAELDDLITRVSPRVLMGMYSGKARLELALSADSYAYSDYPDEDYTTVIAQLGMRLGNEDGIYFAVSDKYLSTEDRREQERLIKEAYTVNVARAELGYKPLLRRRFGASLSLEHKTIAYDEVLLEPLNQSTIGGVLALGYRVLPLTSISLEGIYSTHDYSDSLDESTDADSSSVGGGIAVSLAPRGRASGHIRTGYISRDYENETDPAGNRYPDEGYIYYDMELEYKAGLASRLGLTAYRGFAEAVDLSLGSIAFSAHYLRSGFGLAISGRFGKWYGFDIKGGAERREYAAIAAAAAGRLDDVLNASIELRVFYSDWLMCAAGYAVMDIDSNDSLRDEEHEMATFRVEAGF